MTQAMFDSDSSDWEKLELFDVLALRAFAPAEVFTPSTMDKYLHAVRRRADLVHIAEVMFTKKDFEFLTQVELPNEELRPVIKGLMRLAYDYGIRPADRRI